MPVSDGAGYIVAVGSKVAEFRLGDSAIPTFFPRFIAGTLTPSQGASSLGAQVDGVLQEYVVCHEDSIVRKPPGLSFGEASTLPCAALTAWNSLYGSRPLQPGNTVLTQGTGGVSIFALQFAVAGGAEVISTTSSAEKAERLKQLGAHHIINYREDPEWGATAKTLSFQERGADKIIEIGGPGTLEQSSKAAAMDSEVTIVGRRSVEAGSKEQAAWSPHGVYHGTRRILVGSRQQFEDMNRAIEINKIKPVIDQKVFGFEDAPLAFEYLEEQGHFGKVVIRLGQ